MGQPPSPRAGQLESRAAAGASPEQGRIAGRAERQPAFSMARDFRPLIPGARSASAADALLPPLFEAVPGDP